MTKLSASNIRIDGSFEDRKDVKVFAYAPKVDAKGAFDITKVCAASLGSTIYLRMKRLSRQGTSNSADLHQID